jgi:hypothetical protein
MSWFDLLFNPNGRIDRVLACVCRARDRLAGRQGETTQRNSLTASIVPRERFSPLAQLGSG